MSAIVRRVLANELQILRGADGFGQTNSVYTESGPTINVACPTGSAGYDDQLTIVPPTDGRIWQLIKITFGQSNLTALGIKRIRVDSQDFIDPNGLDITALVGATTITTLFGSSGSATVAGFEHQAIIQGGPVPIYEFLFIEWNGSTPVGPGFNFHFAVYVIESYAPKLARFPFRR